MRPLSNFTITSALPTESVPDTGDIMACNPLRSVEITNFINSSDSLNTNIVNITSGIDDEKQQILEWLSPLEPHQRHHSVRADRIDSVGNWFLETDEFRNWSGASGGDGYVPPVLFCYGDPGVGKTYLR